MFFIIFSGAKWSLQLKKPHDYQSSEEAHLEVTCRPPEKSDTFTCNVFLSLFLPLSVFLFLLCLCIFLLFFCVLVETRLPPGESAPVALPMSDVDGKREASPDSLLSHIEGKREASPSYNHSRKSFFSLFNYIYDFLHVYMVLCGVRRQEDVVLRDQFSHRVFIQNRIMNWNNTH
eukprot:TRINITY_DN5319_c0_g2_i5.p2 TRINITY_DN5319_c0_g2~~TRINITY_DN5319_c0_g2_i5.p2  ORF type:complete len:175 (+),score=5.35 TRINITY_DN5319_c0_g2_i5:934-1458(+)